MTPRIIAKTEFYGRQVLARSERRNRRILFRVGGYARTVMRNSMKRRKGPAPPGQPPHAHAGQLKNLIRFAVDNAEGSVAAGPIPFSGSDKTKHRGTLPALINEGGAATIPDNRRRAKRRRVRVTYKPRPFTDPALELAAARLAQEFRNQPL